MVVYSESQCEEGKLEGRLVAEVAAGCRGRPRVVRRCTAAEAAATSAAAAAVAAGVAPAPTAAALGLGDLCGGVAQRRADLVDLYFEDGALLAFLGLIAALLEPALDDDPHAALQRLGDVLRCLPPDVAREEEALAVLPLVGGLVEEPWRR